MNRRSLLINGLKAAGAGALAAAVPSTALASPSSDGDWSQVLWSHLPKAEHAATIHRMIKEQGDWWMQVRDREDGKNPIILFFGDNATVFEVSHNSQRWHIKHRKITTQEAREVAEFQMNRRWPNNPVGLNVGDLTFTDSDHYIRAFIKNGRKPEWNWSVETL